MSKAFIIPKLVGDEHGTTILAWEPPLDVDTLAIFLFLTPVDTLAIDLNLILQVCFISSLSFLDLTGYVKVL